MEQSKIMPKTEKGLDRGTGRWLEPGAQSEWRMIPRGFADALELFLNDTAEVEDRDGPKAK